MNISENNEKFQIFVNSIRGVDIETDMEIFEILCLKEFVKCMIDILKTYPGKPIEGFDKQNFQYVFDKLKKMYKNIEAIEPLFYKNFISIIKEIAFFRIYCENAIKLEKSMEMILYIKGRIKNSLKKLFEILILRLFSKKIELIFKYLKTVIDYGTYFFLEEIAHVFMEQRKMIYDKISNYGNKVNVRRKIESENNDISQNIIVEKSSKKQKIILSQEISNNNIINGGDSFVRKITINVPIK